VLTAPLILEIVYAVRKESWHPTEFHLNLPKKACNVCIKGRHLSWKNFIPAIISD
jgi:hypothetical protein